MVDVGLGTNHSIVWRGEIDWFNPSVDLDRCLKGNG